eukprot:6912964-Alexandrium_andersonii.AAC.1
MDPANKKHFQRPLPEVPFWGVQGGRSPLATEGKTLLESSFAAPSSASSGLQASTSVLSLPSGPSGAPRTVKGVVVPT